MKGGVVGRVDFFQNNQNNRFLIFFGFESIFLDFFDFFNPKVGKMEGKKSGNKYIILLKNQLKP